MISPWLLILDILIFINDKNITSQSYKDIQNNLDVEVTFNIKRFNYEDDLYEYHNLKITPKQYTYKVSKATVFTRNSDNAKIGHFIYDSFSARSTEEIDKAFD